MYCSSWGKKIGYRFLNVEVVKLFMSNIFVSDLTKSYVLHQLCPHTHPSWSVDTTQRCLLIPRDASAPDCDCFVPR